jgi:plastocyanin
MFRTLVVAVFVLALGTAGAAGAAAQTSHTVTQKGKKFSPNKLTVQPGDSVLFVNDDPVVHNVFSETPGFEFNLKRQPAGASAGVPFTRVGVAEIRCAIHPSMKLTITVR